jgi:hypothetical protein
MGGMGGTCGMGMGMGMGSAQVIGVGQAVNHQVVSLGMAQG